MTHRSTGRLKVVHIVVAGQIGGAERFLVNLASRPVLSGADHCVALMTPNPKLRAFFAEAGLRVRDRGRVHENPLATLWRSFGPLDLAWLVKILREEEADIIQAHTYGSHALAARAALHLRLPLLRTEHGVRHYRDPTCALARYWSLRATSRIVAVSAYVARFVASIAPEAQDKIEIIPNGIAMADFPPAPLRSEGPCTFFLMSRLEPIKRVDLAITAVAQTPGVRLNIAGDGRLRHSLERLAQRLGVTDRVRFLGHLPDPRPAITDGDILINCTREEGLGLAIIEAAAMQRPAVAFDDGGVPEIVQHGRTGWLVRDHSAEGLAAAMAMASADRAQVAAFGAEARRWVETRFDLDHMCKAYSAVYSGLGHKAADAWSIA